MDLSAYLVTYKLIYLLNFNAVFIQFIEILIRYLMTLFLHGDSLL